MNSGTCVILAVLLVCCCALSSGGTWATWYHDPNHIEFSPQYTTASDPSVIFDPRANLFRMYYTCIDYHAPPPGYHLLICSATSPNGSAPWAFVPTLGGFSGVVQGAVVSGRNNTIDTDLETAGAFYDEHETLGSGLRYLLYYGAYYRNPNTSAPEHDSDLQLAVSDDGVNFTRWNGGAPVLARTPGWYDSNQIFSPALLRDPKNASVIWMYYCGHCLRACTPPAWPSSFWTLAAWSTDFVSWTKFMDRPVVPYTGESNWHILAGDPSILSTAPDEYYLFLSGGWNVVPPEPCIGLAFGRNPLGPWTFTPECILVHGANTTAAGKSVFAPSAFHNASNLYKLWLFQSKSGGAQATIGVAVANVSTLYVHSSSSSSSGGGGASSSSHPSEPVVSAAPNRCWGDAFVVLVVAKVLILL